MQPPIHCGLDETGVELFVAALRHPGGGPAAVRKPNHADAGRIDLGLRAQPKRGADDIAGAVAWSDRTLLGVAGTIVADPSWTEAVGMSAA